MSTSMQDKVVLVTGASGAIGSATVRAVVAAGARPVINHLHDPGGVAALTADLHGTDYLVHEADVADETAVGAMVQATVEHFGRIDVLVNNAGIMDKTEFTATSLETWERTLRVNLTGSYLCSRTVAPHMIAAGQGVIINLSSQLAFKGAAGYTAYCAAKAGVAGLTRAMARELGPTVRTNAVAPGPVTSPMIEAHQTEEWMAERTGPLVIGRLAQPAEVARAVLYLASDDASLMHGQTLHANGGGVLA